MFNQQKANKIARKIFQSDNDNIFAIKYRPEEAFLLAHAFKDGLSFYGISQITKGEDLKTVEQELYNEKKDCSTNCFYSFDYGMRSRFTKQFGEKTLVYVDPVTGIFYSKLDTLFGNKDEMSKDIEKRLIPHIFEGQHVEWEHFFATQGAIDFCKTIMDSMEIEIFEKNLNKKLKEIETIILNSTATIEKPYVVDLFGTDDASFSKSLATEEEAFELLEKIEKDGHSIVYQEMIANL